VSFSVPIFFYEKVKLVYLGLAQTCGEVSLLPLFIKALNIVEFTRSNPQI